MDPNFVPSVSVNSPNWASWLISIALHPHQHSILTQVDNQVQFLNTSEMAQMRSQGKVIHQLTMEKMIKITQKMWKDGGVKQIEKEEMFAGLRYIHQQRTSKYQRLSWLGKIFAWLRGVEAQLKTEAREITLLEATLNSSEEEKIASKAQRTGLSLSLVNAIERTWKEMLKNKEEATTKVLEGHRVIFIPKDGEIYLKEAYISKGSYKASFMITPFHSLKTSEDRGSLVILQAVDGVLEEIENQEEEESSDESCQEEVPASGSDHHNVDSSPQATKQKDKTEIHEKEASEGFFSSVVINEDQSLKMPTGIQLNQTLVEQQINNPAYFLSIGEEEDKNYQKEAKNCLAYGKLPGIWPTHKVVTIDKRTAIIQPIAGYSLKTTEGKEIKVISLEDMCILFNKNLLSKNDQLLFLKMGRDFLTGVASLHEKDVIHRDLKPENILCSPSGVAAVSDLGTLCVNRIDSKESQEKTHNPEKKFLIGTPSYIPPEVPCYRRNVNWTKISTAVDIWAIGLILWQSFSGKLLADHPIYQALGSASTISPLQLVELIGEYLSNPNQADAYNKIYPEPKEKASLAHLVWRCTRPDPIQRPSIEQLIKDFELYAKYTENKMNRGKVESIHETFRSCPKTWERLL